jgi:hypothetical protein
VKLARPSTLFDLEQFSLELAEKAALDVELAAAETLVLRIRRAVELNEAACGILARRLAADDDLRVALARELEAPL